jgi:CO/xanthine dehydrogenase FAD-binding subunit
MNTPLLSQVTGRRAVLRGVVGTAVAVAWQGFPMVSWSQQAAAGVRVSADGLNTDLHGSAEYRASLIPVLAGRAVAAA